MLPAFLSGLLVLTSLFQSSDKVEISFGPHYSPTMLYLDEEDPQTEGLYGGEVGIVNFIPHVGLKLRGGKVEYDAPVGYSATRFEYMPLILCTSFDMIPFLRLPWVRLTVETGFGLFLWRGVDSSGETIELANGETMDEKDLGFVGGITFQIRPVRYFGVEYAMRYNHIASSNLEKYGFFDKDEKLWEHGIGVKVVVPL